MKRKTKNKLKMWAMVLFTGAFSLGVYLNSEGYAEYKDSVYSDLKSSYIVNGDNEQVVDLSDFKADKKVEAKEVKLTSITMDTDLNGKTGMSVEQAEKLLSGTPLEGKGLGEYFVKAEQEYDINGLYLIGLAMEESGAHLGYLSPIALDKHNLFGWGAYDRDPYKNAVYFDTYGDGILHVASKVKANYLTKGGSFYHGSTPKGVDVSYCTDGSHARKIINIIDNKMLPKLEA